MRLVSGFCVAALVVIGVSGCDATIFEGPASLTLDEGVLLVAVCDDVTTTRAFGTVDDGTDSARFWEASGRAKLSAGDVFSMAEPPDQLENTQYEEPSIEPGNTIAISIIAFDLPGEGMNGDIYTIFTIPAEGLPTDQWLHPDGTLSDERCE